MASFLGPDGLIDMWAQLLSAGVGIWLMAAPAVLGYAGPAATNDHIVGPTAASFAVIALWQATRGARWMNLPLGVWLILAPWILGYAGMPPTINSSVAGLVLATLSFVHGSRTHRYAGGWMAAWRRAPQAGPTRD